MAFPYTKGQRVVIELKSSQIFEADFEKGTNDRIDVTNVMEYPKGIQLNERLSFYQIEIMSVLLVEESTSTEKPCINVIAVPRVEYERLKNMIHNYIYMAVMDINYIHAVTHLNSCESVGIVGLWCKYGRFRRLSLLVLSTWDQVYIFDLKFYGMKDFPLDLKAILEAEGKRKIVHDSATLVDCLVHCHKVEMNNIFDTKIADLQIQKKNTGCVPTTTRSLSECLACYLNFPSTFLKQALDVSPQEWEQRPLSDLQKVHAALLATYLINLKNKQLEMLLKDYYETMKVYSQNFAKPRHALEYG